LLLTPPLAMVSIMRRTSFSSPLAAWSAAPQVGWLVCM
jgi:hypothetical protein